jgi:hypothetical protein
MLGKKVQIITLGGLEAEAQKPGGAGTKADSP